MPPIVAHACTASLVAILVLIVSCAPGDRRDLDTASAALDDTEWRLTGMAGSDVGADRSVTIRFQSGGRVTGRSFINQYFARFSADSGGGIDLDEIGSTLMAGPEELMHREREYFGFLETADAFRRANGTLYLERAGEVVLRFDRE